MELSTSESHLFISWRTSDYVFSKECFKFLLKKAETENKRRQKVQRQNYHSAYKQTLLPVDTLSSRVWPHWTLFTEKSSSTCRGSADRMFNQDIFQIIFFLQRICYSEAWWETVVLWKERKPINLRFPVFSVNCPNFPMWCVLGKIKAQYYWRIKIEDLLVDIRV